MKKSESIISYGLLVMTTTHTLTHVFTRVHTTLFPILKDEFSLSLQQLGIIAAIPPLCQAILSIPTGLLSDKLGSKKMILISLAASTVGAVVAARARNAIMLIFAVSLLYVNTTVYHPAAYSFVTRLFSPKDRLRALGIHGAGGTFGVAIGPISISVIMGLLALGWREVYIFWLIPLLLGVVATLRITSEPQEDLPDEDASSENSVQATSLLSASLILFLAFIGVRMVASSMSQSFIALYLVESRGLSESLSSFVIGSTTLVGIVASPLGGYLAVRFGEKRWLLTALSLAYASFGLAFLLPNNWIFIALYLTYGFLNVLGMAANSAIMAKLSPGRQRGLAYALFFLPGSIMGAVAPIIAASIAEAFTLTSIFYASTAVFFLSLGVLRFGVRVRDS